MNTAEPLASICTVWSSTVVTLRNGLKNDVSGTPLIAWIMNLSRMPTPTPMRRSVASTATIVATKIRSCSEPILKTLMNSRGDASRNPV